MKYRIIIEEDEDGAFVAECPALPGCISDGDTKEQALKNIKDAIKLYVQSINNETLRFRALAKKSKSVEFASVSVAV